MASAVTTTRPGFAQSIPVTLHSNSRNRPQANRSPEEPPTWPTPTPTLQTGKLRLEESYPCLGLRAERHWGGNPVFLAAVPAISL